MERSPRKKTNRNNGQKITSARTFRADPWFKHDYDRAGNRLNRQDMVNPTWSKTYDYDEMDQIASMTRTGHSESWQYDPTGNWMAHTKNNVVENRSHNAANEILTGVVHDANGNMIVMPKPSGGGTFECKYDAWNRMVEVVGVARYEYDSRNYRIRKTVGNVASKSFFNNRWQELESRTGDMTTAYVWGLRYIDDLVLREKGDEKRYSLADPNWNVVAVVDENGIVQERLQYDAFGRVNGLTSDWDRTFTGQVLDQETMLKLYKNRHYNPRLGRFIQRDGIEYLSGDVNIYRYVQNNVTSYVDPIGSKKACGRVSIYNEKGQVYPMPGGGTTAGGGNFKCMAEYLQGNPVPFNGRGLWAATSYAKKNDCCINHLDVIDHGYCGNQNIGGKNIQDYNLTELCESLCDGASVTFFGCTVASGGATSMAALLKECPKISTVTACSGLFLYPGEWFCGDCSVPISALPRCDGTIVTYTPTNPPQTPTGPIPADPKKPKPGKPYPKPKYPKKR